MRAKQRLEEEEARILLGQIGRPPSDLLRAFEKTTDLSLDELGALVGRSGFTVRRWRNAEDALVPAPAVCAIEDLRAITAMLVDARYARRPLTNFLRSRNPGLGRDRPLDGLRHDVGEFARVEHVTQSFIDGIPPELGRPVIARPADDNSVSLDVEEPVRPEGGGSGRPPGVQVQEEDREVLATH